MQCRRPKCDFYHPEGQAPGVADLDPEAGTMWISISEHKTHYDV